MESVGELLRTTRESQGRTVDDVVKATRMSRSIVESLEDDRFSALPAAVYVKGHLRTYAHFLGLDEEDVVQMYLRFTQQQESDELDEWDAVEVEIHERRKSFERRWALIAAGVVVAIVVIVLVVKWVSQPAPPLEYDPAAAGQTEAGNAGNSGDAEDPEGQEQVLEAPIVVEGQNEAAPEDTMIVWNKLELMAVARERTWVKVAVDGEVVTDITMLPGQRRLWEAEEEFTLDVGNGGGLDLFLNGEPLGTAGSDRRLVEGLVVTEDGIRE
jgi:cytoskeletal protein RodZ